MKKHLKIFSAVLSLVLAVCTIQAVFFQALAADEDTTTVAYDDEYTYDEATDDEFDLERSLPVSIEVIDAPVAVEADERGNIDMSFWDDVVFLITYEDGYTEYFQSSASGFNLVDLPTHYSGDEPIEVSARFDDGNSLSVYWRASYENIDGSGRDIFLETEVKVENVITIPENSIVKCELTKLPDKVFEAPYYTGVRPDTWEQAVEFLKDSDINNSIAQNMNGAEFTVTFANGDTKVITIKDENRGYGEYYYCVYYQIIDLEDERFPGYTLCFNVYDSGNYNAKIFVETLGASQNFKTDIEFTARSVENPNPELPTTDDMKYNEAISSPDEGAKSTIDEVATPDSKATDSNTKSTNDNAVVATGDVAVAAGVAVVMLIAAAVMVILKRRKSVLN